MKRNCIRVFADEFQINSCRKLLEENKTSFRQLSNVLALAGNEVRLKIIYLLEEENELCPCDLADILDMSIPAISQHLRKLKDSGVVETRRSGQTIFYSITSTHLDILRLLFKHIGKETTENIVA